MTDVTDLVSRYRLALCHIWNNCIWCDQNLRDWESVESFQKVQIPLFNALVSDALQLATSDRLFGPEFSVVPGISAGQFAGTIQVNIGMPRGSTSGIWMTIAGPLMEGDIALSLVDFFDWRPLAYIGLNYYMALITEYPAHPEHVGQHALIGVDCARVFMIP